MVITYDTYKLSHSGITKWTTFEGYLRKRNQNSFKNLLSQVRTSGEYNPNSTIATNFRNLNEAQSRKLKRYCNKLSYYTAIRKFTSKKTGTYSMKVAFITLTAPAETSHSQFLKAFDSFLDYLRRTANCVYVWKKELGETNGKLHVHIIVNNFIPYYIVSWKWKRLLISQNVKWPTNEHGKETNSHTKIELPKSKKHIATYIAKYLSKAYELPRDCGYVWGKSAVIDTCKENIFIANELDYEELQSTAKAGKIIGDKYVKHCCIDILTLKEICPKIYNYFERQYLEFNSILTLPQKFNYI